MNLKETLKSILRLGLGATSGNSIRVLTGPLKGRRLLKQDGLSQLSMLFGTYEKSFADAFSARVRNASVVYDIGANTGYFSLLAAQQMPESGQVVAFEPMPQVQQDLANVIESNYLQHQVACSQLALSDTTGRLRMFMPASDKTGVIESALQGRQYERENGIEVSTSTLDDFVYAAGNPVPDLLKIDVEGGEASVLSGATRLLQEARPTILLEVHGRAPAEDVWKTMTLLNYNLTLITGEGETLVRDYESWMQLYTASKWSIYHCVLSPDLSKAEAA